MDLLHGEQSDGPGNVVVHVGDIYERSDINVKLRIASNCRQSGGYAGLTL